MFSRLLEVLTGTPGNEWWRDAVIYQLYPASFLDTTGSGTGDLPGILSKLDYLKELGVDCIWISPFYKSPQYDLGYDISDYQDVHEAYGTLADMEAIIAKCKKLGLKIIFDLVINHSSHEHRWFKESRSSKDNPKRDYYYWKPPKMIDGKRHPPNNWRAIFGGSVWTWDETTQEYYLHLFAEQQPDLNWELPAVRKELFEEAISFWLKKGVDGMRIDTISLYSKRLDFPDAPVTEPYADTQPCRDLIMEGPRLHEFIREMIAKAFAKHNAVSIGECSAGPEYQKILPYVKASNKEINMAIQFGLTKLDKVDGLHYIRDWKLSEFKHLTSDAQILAHPDQDAHCCTYLESHDQARCVSRYGSDKPEHRVASAKLLATYLLTLSGTIIIYQGQEIGQVNMPKEWSIEEEYHDLSSIGWWKGVQEEAKAKNDPSLLEKGRAGLQRSARDHARNGVNWDTSKNGGFSTAEKCWMRSHGFETINVAQQLKDDSSPLAYYRELLAFRKEHTDVLSRGIFEIVDPKGEETFLYIKHTRTGHKKAFVALNFTPKDQAFDFPHQFKTKPRLAFGSIKGPLPESESKVRVSAAQYILKSRRRKN